MFVCVSHNSNRIESQCIVSSVNGDTVDASVQVFDQCSRITRLGGQHAVPSWPSQPLRTYRIISSKFHLKRNEKRIISDLVLHVFLCTPHDGSLNRLRFLCDYMVPVKFFITFFLLFFSSFCFHKIRVIYSHFALFSPPCLCHGHESQTNMTKLRRSNRYSFEYVYFFFDYLRRLVFHVPTVTLHSSPSGTIQCHSGTAYDNRERCAEKSTVVVAKHSRFRVHTQPEQKPPPLPQQKLKTINFILLSISCAEETQALVDTLYALLSGGTVTDDDHRIFAV